jgi:hypothetical protein
MDRSKRRRTTGSSTSCPPLETRSLTLDSASSTLLSHKKEEVNVIAFGLQFSQQSQMASA